MTPSDSHGQRHGRGPEVPEDDPTGIRDLLAALPDPGPMPEDLVQRIGARLAVEQAHREQGASRAPGLASRSDSVIDLAAERTHRRPGRTVALLGVAAAGLLVATVAIGELAGVGPAAGPAFDSAARVPARSAAGSDSGGAADEAAGGAPEADAGLGSQRGAADGEGGAATDLGEELSVDVVVLPDLGPVSPTDYRERVLEVAAGVAAQGAGGASTEALLTKAGARSCWATVAPDERWPTLRAAQAELDGERVVVLLGMQDVAAGQALVLPWGCTRGDDVAPVTSAHWGY